MEVMRKPTFGRERAAVSRDLERFRRLEVLFMLHDPVFLHFLAIEDPRDGVPESLLFLFRKAGHVWSPSGCPASTVIQRPISHSETSPRAGLRQKP
jgi:hypothetical protein